jgi:hypothetical protein
VRLRGTKKDRKGQVFDVFSDVLNGDFHPKPFFHYLKDTIALNTKERRQRKGKKAKLIIFI